MTRFPNKEMSIICLVFAPVALWSQAPRRNYDEAFFKGDPQAIMLACADHALVLKPHKERVLAQAGRIQLAAGDQAQAEKDFHEAARPDAETARWTGQGWLEWGAADKGAKILAETPMIGWGAKDEVRAGAVLLLKSGRPKEADKLMMRLFEADPEDWENMAAFAGSCLAQNKRGLAAAWYARATASKRTKAELWSDIALALAEAGKGPGSPLPAGAAVPKHPDAAFFSQDPRQLMLLCAEESARLGPRDPHILAIRGEIWLSAGDRAKAEAAFTEAINRDYGDPRVRRLVAQAWMRFGFKKEALSAYKGMADLLLSGRFDNRKNVLCWAASDLMEAGFTQEAVGYMDQSFELDKDDPDNCIAFGRAALLAGQRAPAALYFARAVAAEPHDVDVWLDIASAHADYLRARNQAR